MWALGLGWLAKAAGAWRAQEAEGGLVGREYEKWRPVLAVGSLLEESGIEGLGARMSEVMRAYQGERKHLVADDETCEILQAAYSAVAMAQQTLRERGMKEEELWRLGDRELPVTTMEIAQLVLALRYGETGDLSKDSGLAKRVGHAMSRLRFRPTRDQKGRRAWMVSLDRALELVRAYGALARKQ